MTTGRKASQIDTLHYKLIRNNISTFIRKCSKRYDRKGFLLLDIAPQIHEGAKPFFKKARISTLDIDRSTNPTYILDICKTNKDVISDNFFELIVCTEVLEHVLNPFKAVSEIYRILKPKGLVFISTPFDFRIHGPLPDCWRFTEHGLRVLLNKFKILELNQLESKSRRLMPIHYTVIAEKV